MGSIGDASVEVLLRRRRYAGTAMPIENPEGVMAEVEQTIARYGRKGAAWRMGVASSATPPHSREEIAQAMPGRAVIRITLPAPISAGCIDAVRAATRPSSAARRRSRHPGAQGRMVEDSIP